MVIADQNTRTSQNGETTTTTTLTCTAQSSTFSAPATQTLLLFLIPPLTAPLAPTSVTMLNRGLVRFPSDAWGTIAIARGLDEAEEDLEDETGLDEVLWGLEDERGFDAERGLEDETGIDAG